MPERPGGVKIAKMIPTLTGRPCVRSNFTSVHYPQQMEHCPSHVTTRYIFVEFIKCVRDADRLEQTKHLYFVTSGITGMITEIVVQQSVHRKSAADFCRFTAVHVYSRKEIMCNNDDGINQC